MSINVLNSIDNVIATTVFATRVNSKKDNIFITGTFVDSITLESKTLKTDTSAEFLAQYSSSGRLLLFEKIWDYSGSRTFSNYSQIFVVKNTVYILSDIINFIILSNGTKLTEKHGVTFVISFNIENNLLINWFTQIQGSNRLSSRITADQNNVYISYNQNSNGNLKFVLVSLNVNGEVNFIIKENGNGTSIITDLMVDSNTGDIIATGSFRGKVLVLYQVLKSSRFNLWIIRFSNKGKLIWSLTGKVGRSSSLTSNNLSIDSNGNIYVVGTFINRIKLESTILETQFNNSPNSFLSKVSPNGDWIWSRQIIYDINSNQDDSIDPEITVTVNCHDQIFVEIYFSGKIIFIDLNEKLSQKALTSIVSKAIAESSPNGEWMSVLAVKNVINTDTSNIYSANCLYSFDSPPLVINSNGQVVPSKAILRKLY
jgi:hypothetical protein